LHDTTEEPSEVPTTPRPVLVLLTLAALVASAFTFAACGGGDDRKDDVASVLKDTFGSGKPVKSGKLNVAVALDAQGLAGLQGPVAIKLAGPFQSGGDDELPAFDFDLSLDAGGQKFTAGAVSTGDKGFLTVQGQAFAVGDQLFNSFKTGYRQAQKESEKQDGGTTFKTLGIDPLRWLADARKAGSEDVGGTKTTHITASIDVPKFLIDINTLLQKADKLGVTGAQSTPVPTTLTAQQRVQISQAVKSAEVDVYTGEDDRLLRRVKVALAFDVPQSARKAAGGLTSGTLRLDLTIADLNKDQTIGAPANARPLEELTAQLGGGAASSGSGTATTPSTGSGSGTTTQPAESQTPPAPAANPEYLTCLDEAGTDLAKVQKCADVLKK
jgi:hypothetical protein